jgi:hypothetical protein
MLELIRKYIISKRTKLVVKKKILKKSINNNDELSYSIKSFGEKNRNKIFYVINRTPGGGMFSNLNFVIHHLLIAEKFKFTPIIDMKNFPTFYNEKIKINNSYNSWDYYFEKINQFKIKDVYQSKNVIFTNKKTNKSKFFDGFEQLSSEHTRIAKKYIKFNKLLINESNNYVKKNFKGKKILGVHFRGSDQKTQERHPLPATIKQVGKNIRYLLKKHKFDKFFLITEEEKYLNYFNKPLKNKILFFNSFVSSKVNIFEDNPKKRRLHRYHLGRENIINMLCLSKTDHILCVSSNFPDAAIFFADKKIPITKINNGFNSNNIFIAQFFWYLKKLLPSSLGGYK